jgi:predicted transcriptional regulator YheO
MAVPRTRQECELVIAALKHVVKGLEAILGRDVEVVLHDLSRPGHSVVAIAHGEITGRTVGSPIISGPYNDLGLQKLISGEGSGRSETHTLVTDYRTRTREGRELDSTSVILRDHTGRAYAALCVNADRTRLRELQALVRDIAGATGGKDGPDDTDDVASIDSLVREIIEGGIDATGKPVSMMNKDDKIEAVRHMNDRGLFLIRSSVDLVAASLAVSRFTIYNYLDELKSGSDEAPGGNGRTPSRRSAKAG